MSGEKLAHQACQQQLQSMSDCAGSVDALQAALTGTKAVVCTGRLGSLLQAAEQQDLEHLVAVSSAGQPLLRIATATLHSDVKIHPAVCMPVKNSPVI